MPRNEKGTRFKRMASQEYEDRPVLNMKVCYHDDRYSIEVQVPSLFQENTVSCVRIVNGVDKYVTESMPTAKEEDIASGKPIAKDKLRQKHTVTLWKRPFRFSKKIPSTFSSNWVLPSQGGCSQFLISSRKCDSSICGWKNKFSIFFGFSFYSCS